MKKKTEVFLVVGVATLITCYFYRKIFKKKKVDLESLIKEGDKYFNNNDYKNAIIYYKKCLYMRNNQEFSNKLGICYYKIKQYKEALDYLNYKTEDLEIIKLRIECYKNLEKHKEYLKDFALYESFIKNDKMQDEIVQILKEICEKEANCFISNENIVIKKEEILKGLISIKNVEVYYDEIVNDIIKPDIHNNILKSDNQNNNISKPDNQNNNISKPDSHKEKIIDLLKAIILFYKGKRNESLSLLEKSTFKYSILIKGYFYILSNRQITFELPLDDKISTLYFHSKIYKEKADIFLLQALEKGSSLSVNDKDFLYVDLLLFYISKKDTMNIQKIIDEVSDSITPPLLDLLGEYYLKNGDRDKFMNLIESYKDVPEKMLLMGLYYLSIDNKPEAINILYKCISEFPSFYKSYLYLGNILINEDLDESRRLFHVSLKYASSYDEVYVVKQSLVLIEIHEYIKINKE